MGAVSSRPDESAALYLRDQNRLSLASLVITSSQRRNSIHISPNSYPATRALAARSTSDGPLLEFVQDPETLGLPIPSLILKLNSDEELVFTVTFTIRQTADESGEAQDTTINGLTCIYGSTQRDIDNLVTREFHADPNLHKNANVDYLGDFHTRGEPAVTCDWAWKWKAPKTEEDAGGGWRNTCSFVEYNQRAHALQTLASFSFWVQNTTRHAYQPSSPSDAFMLAVPSRIRVPSSQSVDSRTSNGDLDVPVSPILAVTEPSGGIPFTTTNLQAGAEQVKVDLSSAWPMDEVSATDDGPVFRAAMKQLEERTGNMRMQLKRMMKKAETAHQAQLEANEAFSGFIDALKSASSTNANAVKPALDNYFDQISREITAYEKKNAMNLQKIIIEPMSKLYQIDIKQAEAKKRDFEEESKEYYNYVTRYLAQRHDSVKAKQSDSKYQTKRKNFELKRFDYSSFMQDLSGGRKEQEVLSYLTKYADAQARAFLEASKKVESLLPRLDALSSEVSVTDKEYQYQRKEREEKRRVLEKSNLNYTEPESSSNGQSLSTSSGGNGSMKPSAETDLNRANSTSSHLTSTTTANSTANAASELSRSPGSLSHAAMSSPQNPARFKGIRDLEERDASQIAAAERNGSVQRKEGLLWALNRPSGHVDPRAALKQQQWHKFWIVLDGGKLSEYSNWKQKLDLHMDPIDLRTASVREARNADRRFCFEVITPYSKRVYQAPSEEDMKSWITSINNALQSAVEGRGIKDIPLPSPIPKEEGSSFRRDLSSILTGKSPSVGHAQAHHPSSIPNRRITVGARPTPQQRIVSTASEDEPDKLLRQLRNHDEGNSSCADCASRIKVEWVSINLAITLCIECSGIHRSLGTHVSKIRSLTLDVNSFTPDIVELLLLVGNRISNMVWEAKLGSVPGIAKCASTATREERLRYITSKYVERLYVEPLSPTLSHSLVPDETLLAAIKKNEIQQVLYALALRASPNVADKSRGTHAVYLALAAADPAMPDGSSSSPSSSSTLQNQQHMTHGKLSSPDSALMMPFPVAEMLLQNGAEIPTQLPSFPLSRSATTYLEGKRGRAAAQNAIPSMGIVDVNERMGRDREPQLHQHQHHNVFSSHHYHNNNNSNYQQGQQQQQQQQDARITKRMSAGGRLARSPIPER